MYAEDDAVLPSLQDEAKYHIFQGWGACPLSTLKAYSSTLRKWLAWARAPNAVDAFQPSPLEVLLWLRARREAGPTARTDLTTVSVGSRRTWGSCFTRTICACALRGRLPPSTSRSRPSRLRWAFGSALNKLFAWAMTLSLRWSCAGFYFLPESCASGTTSGPVLSASPTWVFPSVPRRARPAFVAGGARSFGGLLDSA